MFKPNLIAFIFLLLLAWGCQQEIALNNEGCEVFELEIKKGECLTDSTYKLTINFGYRRPGNELFNLYARNNQLIGTYKLSQLPLTISFKKSGKDFDFIKVAINDREDCFAVKEFESPACKEEKPCTLGDLRTDLGKCSSDSTYHLTIHFVHHFAPGDSFKVYTRNNVLFGRYTFSQLPLTILDFKMSGNQFDFIRIVAMNKEDCFLVKEFESPICREEKKCLLSELRTDTGICNSDSTYPLTINFNHHQNAGDSFMVFGRNNYKYGVFTFSQLPLTIQHFKSSGN